MEETKEVQKLKNCLLNNAPVLFLGAGFSRDAVCDSGIMPTGKELCKELLDNFVEGNVLLTEYDEIKGYKIRELCNCIDSLNGNKQSRETFLTQRLKNAQPNDEGYHTKLINYPWNKIYTVNIDDLVENIYEANGIEYNSYGLKESISSANNNTMDLIKLHGDVRKANEGYIFSKDEYNELISCKINIGLNSFTSEIYGTNDVIFVGASLDEPDFEYYLKIYDDMQLTNKKGELYFIDPYPSVALKQMIKKLGANLIIWDTKQFLSYVSTLQYNPKELERIRTNLNYNMIYRLKDNMKGFYPNYDSNIYQGFSSKWQDIFEGWTFNSTHLKAAQENLDCFMKKNDTTKCFVVYGSSFSGKSTLLKQLGYYLHNKDYEVLEYKGTYINRKVIKEYIQKSTFSNYAILIDNASFYYKVIESMFRDDYHGKNVIILCASRKYYHYRKRYYLEGNCYTCFESVDVIEKDDAETIKSTLEKKSYSSYLLDIPEEKRDAEIMSKKSIVNLIVELTYGIGIRRRIKDVVYDIKKLSPIEKQLLLEIGIFDNADIEYYPIQLFTERFGRTINISGKIEMNNLKIVDYIKYDERGVSLRNRIFHKDLLAANQREILPLLKNLLIYLSRYVYEGRDDMWTIIFQSLINEKRLKKYFKLSKDELKSLLYGLKEYYKDISYFWLQLGLFEQLNGDYSKALSHLQQSQAIQPNSFMIKHAIARNYLKFANSQSNINLANELFEKGESLMQELIDGKEYYIKKARPYSISCFVLEKTKYILKFNSKNSNKELCEMRDMLALVDISDDSYVKKTMKEFYRMLYKLGKTSLIQLTPNSPYYEIMGCVYEDYDIDDVIIEAM